MINLMFVVDSTIRLMKDDLGLVHSGISLLQVSTSTRPVLGPNSLCLGLGLILVSALFHHLDAFPGQSRLSLLPRLRHVRLHPQPVHRRAY
jgi:hypothetical protein